MKFSLILAGAATAAAVHPGYSVGDSMYHVGRWCEGDHSGVTAVACNVDSVGYEFARHVSDHGGWDVIEDCNHEGGSDDDDSDSADRFCIDAPTAGEGYACHEADVNVILVADVYGRKSVGAFTNVDGHGGCRRIKAESAGLNIGNAFSFDAQTGHLSFCASHPKFESGSDNWNFGVDGFECVVNEDTVNLAPKCQEDPLNSVFWARCPCAELSADDTPSYDEDGNGIADTCEDELAAERDWWYSNERSFGVAEGRWGMMPCCPVEVSAEGGCEALETQDTCDSSWGEEDGAAGLCRWQVHPWHPHGDKGKQDGKGKCRSAVACDVGESCQE